MGVANMQWYEERGLTKTVSSVVQEDSVLVRMGRYKVGDTFERQEVTEYYCAGRIDIRDDSKEGYDGWHEYSLAPMRTEDWNALSDWLDDLETDELMSYGDLIESFQLWYGKSIRWADDIWYKCYECELVTDLRETKDHIHKIDCTRKWDKDYE
jgi:hypothetical protein